MRVEEGAEESSNTLLIAFGRQGMQLEDRGELREKQRMLDQINSCDFSAFNNIWSKLEWSKELSKRLEVEGVKLEWEVVKLQSLDLVEPAVEELKRVDKLPWPVKSVEEERDTKGGGGNLSIKLVSNLIECDLWKDEE